MCTNRNGGQEYLSSHQYIGKLGNTLPNIEQTYLNTKPEFFSFSFSFSLFFLISYFFFFSFLVFLIDQCIEAYECKYKHLKFILACLRRHPWRSPTMSYQDISTGWFQCHSMLSFDVLSFVICPTPTVVGYFTFSKLCPKTVSFFFFCCRKSRLFNVRWNE